MQDKGKLVLSEVIKGRRSVRSYLGQSVKKAIIEELIEAARWAPSPHNAQPWHFVIIIAEDKKKCLTNAMAQRYRQDMEADGLAIDIIEDRLRQSLERLSQAPLLILACLSLEKMDNYRDDKRQRAERDMAVQAMGAAIQNLLLTAHYRGLGTCWMCAPLFCAEVVCTALNLPEGFLPQAIITIGYPDSVPAPPPREPLESITLWY